MSEVAIPHPAPDGYILSMTIGDAFRKAQPFVIGFGLPIMLAFVCLTYPVQLQQARDIGTLQSKMDALKDGVSSASADLKMQGATLAAVSSKVDALKDGEARIEDALREVSTDVRKIDARSTEKETDPIKLLSLATGFTEDSLKVVSAAYDRGALYVLPRTKEVTDDLEKAGFKLEQLSPTVSGFKVVVKGFDPAGLDQMLKDWPQGLKPQSK